MVSSTCLHSEAKAAEAPLCSVSQFVVVIRLKHNLTRVVQNQVQETPAPLMQWDEGLASTAHMHPVANESSRALHLVPWLTHCFHCVCFSSAVLLRTRSGSWLTFNWSASSHCQSPWKPSRELHLDPSQSVVQVWVHVLWARSILIQSVQHSGKLPLVMD